jgi:hypothetical protein
MTPIIDISYVLLELGLGEAATEVERALAQACLLKASAAVRRYLRYDPTYAERTEYYPPHDVSQSGRSSVWEVSDTQAFERHLSEASTNILQLRHLPVRVISHLYIDHDGRAGAKAGAFAAETEQTEGVDFWPNYDTIDSDGAKVCKDGMLKSHGRWPSETGSVKIVYYAGYKTAELHGEDTVLDAFSIHEVVSDESVRRFLKIKQRQKKTLAGWAGPLASETLGDYSYSTNTALLDKIVSGGDIAAENMMRLEEFQNYGLMLGG